MIAAEKNLRECQQQLDADGVMVGVSRQAVAEVLAEIDRLREALEWYGEQARLCRLVHSEGDAGRRALDADGGRRPVMFSSPT